MSTNCLVTRLKASVNNDSLLILNVLQVHAENVSNFTAVISPNNGLEWTNGLTVQNETSIYPVISGTGTLYIQNKYDITQLECDVLGTGSLKIRFDDLKSCMNLENIKSRYGSIIGLDNLSQLNVFNNLRDIILWEESYGSHTIKGNISDLLFAQNTLESLDLRNLDLVQIEMTNVGKFKNLTTVSIQSASEENISGSIEDFVASKRGVSASSGVTFNYPTPAITFNGSRITSKANMQLTWTANTITFDGVTISNSDINY